MNRKLMFCMAVLTASFLALLPYQAHAWCDHPGIVYCGSVVDSNNSHGHTDISRYRCTGTTNFNGKAHVYRLNHPGGPLWISLDWTGTVPQHELWVFLLNSCNANDCRAADPHTIYQDLSAGTYWIIVDGRANHTNNYTLSLYCGDEPLPVELTSYSASNVDGGVALHWSVASERNNDRFEIRREREDSGDLEQIASVSGRGSATTQANYTYTDATAIASIAYTYHLSSVDVNGTRHELGSASAVYEAPKPVMTGDFKLVGNYPNPFNPTTTIRFEVAQAMDLSLQVFDVNGRLIRTLAHGRYAQGSYDVGFDGSDLSSGLYFARLTGASRSDLMKLILMK
jgi:hypothetical protein